MIRTYYRVVESLHPDGSQFLSHEELGVPLLDPDPEKIRMWRGVTVFATLSQARNKARNFPMFGEYIAILQIDDGGPLHVERTGNGRGHHTIWGEPDDIASCVTGVVHMSFEAGD